MEPGNWNEIKIIEKDVELDRQEGDKTGKPQQPTTKNWDLEILKRIWRKEKYTDKIKNLTEPGNENKSIMMTTKVEYNREEDGEIGEQQR